MLSIVEKALLVKLFYKNSESAIATLLAYPFMKVTRDGKEPITSSALNKMMKSYMFFAVTSKKWTLLSSRSYFHDSGADGAIHVGGFCTWGVQCSRSFVRGSS